MEGWNQILDKLAAVLRGWYRRNRRCSFDDCHARDLDVTQREGKPGTDGTFTSFNLEKNGNVPSVPNFSDLEPA